MERAEVTELHFIAPLSSVPSIVNHGILCNKRARAIGHASIANREVQDRRSKVRVPGGRALHEYANLYVNGRNAMLYGVLGFPSRPPTEHLRLCLISVDAEVLEIPNVVIADRNAATDLVRFWPSPEGLQHLNRSQIFSRKWVGENAIADERRQAEMMAEVLVPDRVEPRFLRSVYVCCSQALGTANSPGLSIPISISRYLFFNDRGRYHD